MRKLITFAWRTVGVVHRRRTDWELNKHCPARRSRFRVSQLFKVFYVKTCHKVFGYKTIGNDKKQAMVFIGHGGSSGSIGFSLMARPSDFQSASSIAKVRMNRLKRCICIEIFRTSFQLDVAIRNRCKIINLPVPYRSSRMDLSNRSRLTSPGPGVLERHYETLF